MSFTEETQKSKRKINNEEDDLLTSKNKKDLNRDLDEQSEDIDPI